MPDASKSVRKPRCSHLPAHPSPFPPNCSSFLSLSLFAHYLLPSRRAPSVFISLTSHRPSPSLPTPSLPTSSVSLPLSPCALSPLISRRALSPSLSLPAKSSVFLPFSAYVKFHLPPSERFSPCMLSDPLHLPHSLRRTPSPSPSPLSNPPPNFAASSLSLLSLPCLLLGPSISLPYLRPASQCRSLIPLPPLPSLPAPRPLHLSPLSSTHLPASQPHPFPSSPSPACSLVPPSPSPISDPPPSVVVSSLSLPAP